MIRVDDAAGRGAAATVTAELCRVEYLPGPVRLCTATTHYINSDIISYVDTGHT